MILLTARTYYIMGQSSSKEELRESTVGQCLPSLKRDHWLYRAIHCGICVNSNMSHTSPPCENTHG